MIRLGTLKLKEGHTHLAFCDGLFHDADPYRLGCSGQRIHIWEIRLVAWGFPLGGDCQENWEVVPLIRTSRTDTIN
jgi:hypothetical protein